MNEIQKKIADNINSEIYTIYSQIKISFLSRIYLFNILNNSIKNTFSKPTIECYIFTYYTYFIFQMIPKWRPVQVCCKGYARSSNGTSCVPICSQHCYHGQCVEPDVCKCEPGFGGQACSKCKFCICIQKRIENSVKLKFF